MASDPFRSAIVRDRLIKVGGSLLLLSFFAILILIASRNDFRHAAPVDAVVVRLGTQPDDIGEIPILTVRLGDGSIRQFRTSWAAVKWCDPGSRVSLLKRRNNLQVALKGCQRPRT